MEDERKQLFEIVDTAIRKQMEEKGEGMSTGAMVQCVVDALCDREVIVPPCRKGDTVYWVDALNHIYPIKVGGFNVSVCDAIGSTYMGSFDSGALYLTKKGAKDCVERIRRKSCEDCFKRCLAIGRTPSCIDGQDCSKKHFRERCEELWRAEFAKQQEESRIADCKRCYIARTRRGLDCGTCACLAIKEKFHAEWDTENISNG